VKRKSIVVITKIDAVDEPTLKKLKREGFGRKKITAISAVVGTGVRELVEELWHALHPKERRAVSKARPPARAKAKKGKKSR
jgi:predicted GTPase